VDFSKDVMGAEKRWDGRKKQKTKPRGEKNHQKGKNAKSCNTGACKKKKKVGEKYCLKKVTCKGKERVTWVGSRWKERSARGEKKGAQPGRPKKRRGRYLPKKGKKSIMVIGGKKSYEGKGREKRRVEWVGCKAGGG